MQRRGLQSQAVATIVKQIVIDLAAVSRTADLCSLKAAFEYCGRSIVDRRMQALRIVELFDPVDQIEPALCTGCVMPAMHPFDFKRLEEAFHRGVIPAIGASTHVLHHPVLIDQFAMLITRVLNAAIGMHDQTWRRLAAPVGHRQGVADELCFHPLAHRPADNLATAQIEDAGQVEPALVGGDVGEVGKPRPVDRPAVASTFATSGLACAESVVTRYGLRYTGRSDCRNRLCRTRS